MPRQANQARGGRGRGGAGDGTQAEGSLHSASKLDAKMCKAASRPGAVGLWVAVGAGCPVWPAVLFPRNSLGLCLGAPLALYLTWLTGLCCWALALIPDKSPFDGTLMLWKLHVLELHDSEGQAYLLGR